MLEKDLQKQILDYLARMKGRYWRINSGAVKASYKGKSRFIRFNSIKGCSDIIGILPDGRFFAAEIKVHPNKPTEDQKSFIELVNYWGGVGIVAYSLDDVIDTFKKLNL